MKKSIIQRPDPLTRKLDLKNRIINFIENNINLDIQIWKYTGYRELETAAPTFTTTDDSITITNDNSVIEIILLNIASLNWSVSTFLITLKSGEAVKLVRGCC